MKIYDILSKINCSSLIMELLINEPCTPPIYMKGKNELHIFLKAHRTLPYKEYRKLVKSFEDWCQMSVVLNIDVMNKTVDHVTFKQYLGHITKKRRLQNKISNLNFKIDNDSVVFALNDIQEKEYVDNVLELISTDLNKCGISVSLSCDLLCDKPIEIIEPLKVIEPSIAKTKASSTSNRFKKKVKLENYVNVTIDLLKDEALGIKFSGKVFKIVDRKTRLNTYELTIYVVDQTDAIDCVYYVNSLDELDVRVNDNVTIYGNHILNTYRHNYFVKVDKIDVIEPATNLQVTDQQKRIELHAHTKSSEMDSVADTRELITAAYNYGFDAIAITDHMVSHSFPTAQKVANELNKKDPNKQIKIIYGVEFNVVDDKLQAISKCKEQNLEEASYVFFDLETTGLSSRLDEIIEFGAIKVINHREVERKQFFIKPNGDVSKHISNITNITASDLKNAKSIEEEIDTILNFFEGSILVAHNAAFDIGFINAVCSRLNKKPLNNTVIDTYHLAMILMDDVKKNKNLGAVARYYKIAYDRMTAHRADYDAMILMQVYLEMVRDLRLKEITTTTQLYHFQQQIPSYDKLRSYHTMVLAKNQEGLKDLYKLISISHTETLLYRGKSIKNEGEEGNAEPRLLISQLESLRSNLLVGSSCFNSYLFEVARTGSLEELEKEMMFYDYIELQPLNNYFPLITRNIVASEQQLIDILLDIVATANKLNKLIVATGDVHYVYPEQKIFRDVYINAMGISGVRHPLYVRDEVKRINTTNPDQHLRTTQEMLDGYPYLSKQFTEIIVLDNPQKISSMIEEVQPVPKELYTPVIEGSDEKLKQICFENAYAIYGNPLPQIVQERLSKELNSILSNGYGVIYYTSHLLVKQSLDDGYMVGSRGSVGSSFAATMAKITEVNPLVPHYVCPKCHYSHFYVNNEYASGYDLEDKNCPTCKTLMKGDGQDIPFETFLGFEGDKVPDIDLNFSSDYQEKAHNLTKEIFGEDKVFRGGTIGTIAEKTAYGLVRGFFEQVPLYTDKHEAFKEYLTQGATGVKRSTGQHPGGIVVIPDYKDVFDFTPVQYPANNPEASWKTTHYEYHDIESNVLKLDILGHVDPTAMKFLEEVSGIDVSTINMNDPKTLSLFTSTSALMIDERRALDKNGAVGLPEFGTSFVRSMLNDTRPNKFSDLVRISGLSHGTDVWLSNAQAIILDGLTLDDVISCRDDIMTFLSHKGLKPKLAFTIMESVRKGKGLKPDWIEEMQKIGVQDWYIDSAEKIKYLFPKAHAVAYTMMGFRVAWFKVHRPLAFYAQFFSLRCTHFDIEVMCGGADVILAKINDIKTRKDSYDLEIKASAKEIGLLTTLEVALEMVLRGYDFTPLNIHRSPATRFWPDPENQRNLMIPFNAVERLGNSIAENIVKERELNEFLSIEDLSKRAQVNSAAIQELKQLKALDGLSETNQLSLF